MCSDKQNRRAFTLLELLVAITLMNVIALSLYASLYIGFKARDSANNAIHPVRAAQITLDSLQQDIVAALPPTGILAGEFLGVNEKDTKGYDCDSLSFYSSNNCPGWQEAGCDVRKVELYLTPSADTSAMILVRRITTNLLSPKALLPVEEILARDVISLDFKYFDGLNWLELWDSTTNGNSLPMAIEISLVVETELDKENSTEEKEGYRLVSAFTIPCSSLSPAGTGGSGSAIASTNR